MLGDLVAKSMVIADRSGDSVRYRLLETLRQYGRERLAGEGDVEATRDRQEPHGIGISYVFDLFRCVGGQTKRRRRPTLLALNAERFSARRHDPHRRAHVEQHIDQPSRRVQEMFAVVEHQQQPARPDRVTQHIHQRPRWPFRNSQRRRDRARNQGWIANRRKRDKPRAIREPIHHISRKLHHEARLAHATDPRDRHEPMRLEQTRQPRQLARASDQRRALRRQVAGERVERPQRRKVRRQSGMLDLEHDLGPAQIPQPMTTQLREAKGRWKGVPHQVGRRLRAQHLPRMRDLRQTRRPIQHPPEVIVATLLSDSGVKPHPHAQRRRPAPRTPHATPVDRPRRPTQRCRLSRTPRGPRRRCP